MQTRTHVRKRVSGASTRAAAPLVDLVCVWACSGSLLLRAHTAHTTTLFLAHDVVPAARTTTRCSRSSYPPQLSTSFSPSAWPETAPGTQQHVYEQTRSVTMSNWSEAGGSTKLYYSVRYGEVIIQESELLTPSLALSGPYRRLPPESDEDHRRGRLAPSCPVRILCSSTHGVLPFSPPLPHFRASTVPVPRLLIPYVPRWYCRTRRAARTTSQTSHFEGSHREQLVTSLEYTRALSSSVGGEEGPGMYQAPMSASAPSVMRRLPTRCIMTPRMTRPVLFLWSFNSRDMYMVRSPRIPAHVADLTVTCVRFMPHFFSLLGVSPGPGSYFPVSTLATRHLRMRMPGGPSTLLPRPTPLPLPPHATLNFQLLASPPPPRVELTNGFYPS
ncbi:hypothetical protein CERSUDRAFT_99945 [Gelatoporia subvermispora B]|uniref:Uncharacterized protein n=1 Tax=Ceriporiopsis subvermispora (strain B) TaxID=914234 RepID=M2QIR1_CERS8|nr:hypothetical protein CERSUDRAFT_99945 [Gelatoporia subvermispora B]